MDKIIGISGKIGSGKDTLADLLERYLKKKKIKTERRFFASKLKEVNKLLTGYGGYTQEEKNIFLSEFNMTVGESLQKVGEGLRKTFHNNIWVLTALKDLPKDKIIIITDCRYQNEVNLILEKGGILVRLEGDPADVRKNSKRDLNHSSEIDLDHYPHFDFIFENNGPFEKLDEFAKSFANFISRLNDKHNGKG